MVFPVDDLLKASFFGPWVPKPGQTKRVRNHYISIAHWYEAMKFMPVRPDLRDSVLLCPSAKEARKFSKARQSSWRTDWNTVRHSVLLAGLGFLSLDRPDLGLSTMEKHELAAYLKPMKLPDKFIDLCIDQFVIWAAGPKIGTFGANTAPDSVVGKKLTKTVQDKPRWTLVSLCNNKTAWRLHDWALVHFVPVQYIGKDTTRATPETLTDLIKAVNQLIVFEVKGGKKSDVAIQMAKSQKKSVSLELYSPQEQTPSIVPS